MKKLIHRTLAGLGYELRHRHTDPVLAELDRARDLLRLQLARPALWQHTLAQLALSSHLRDLVALQRPTLVIDVGANRGQFALHLRHLGYTGPIISIEPQRALAEALHNLALATDPNWTVLHGAAGDKAGELVLQTFADDTFSSFHEPSAAARSRFGELLKPDHTEKVTVRLLDEWISEVQPISGRILLKTDTQGHDLAVLRGAPGILSRTAGVLAEGSLVPLYDTVATPESLAQLLAPFGLRPAGSYAVSHDEHDLAALELDCLFTRAVS